MVYVFKSKNKGLKMNITEKLASTHLGQKSKGSELYDKSLLVAVPRSENRIAYNIDDKNLPFVGYDIWNCYEVSFLTTNNVPVCGVLKIEYPCNNPSIVESKSLKLYLNSFNMTPLKETVEESTKYLLDTVQKDLSELLQTDIKVKFHKKFTDSHSAMFPTYTPIQDIIDLNNVKCERFNESPEILEEGVINSNSEVSVSFDSMRSNCRVTGQPDFGDVFIHWKSDKNIDLKNLVQYLVSFRKENHFHEECCEMIYKRLWDILQPEELVVAALYTRRGGIDINPIRANKKELLDEELINIDKYTRKTIKQ